MRVTPTIDPSSKLRRAVGEGVRSRRLSISCRFSAEQRKAVEQTAALSRRPHNCTSQGPACADNSARSDQKFTRAISTVMLMKSAITDLSPLKIYQFRDRN
jgi:hypothetical protein